MITLEFCLCLLDLVDCGKTSPSIRSYLCGCGWEISSWVCYVVEENFLYKYALDWLKTYIQNCFVHANLLSWYHSFGCISLMGGPKICKCVSVFCVKFIVCLVWSGDMRGTVFNTGFVEPSMKVCATCCWRSAIIGTNVRIQELFANIFRYVRHPLVE